MTNEGRYRHPGPDPGPACPSLSLRRSQTQTKRADAPGTRPLRFRNKLQPRLRALQVHGAGLAALAGLELVGQALLLFERAHPGRFDGGNVDEGVGAAGLVGDEAVALGVVEKFHCADWHIYFLA